MKLPPRNIFGRRSGCKAFTLIELLTTVSILAVLVALVLPTTSRMMQSANATKCAAKLRSIYTASEAYSSDNNGLTLPSQILNGSTQYFWLYLLRPYLGAKSEWDQSGDARFICPSIKRNSSSAWSWGYGINDCPLYEGSASTATQRLFNWGEIYVPPQSWKRVVRKVELTNLSKRLFLCDSPEWHVSPNAGRTLNSPTPHYDRHGKNRCNVLFYDGHVEALGKTAVEKAVFNPGG